MTKKRRKFPQWGIIIDTREQAPYDFAAVPAENGNVTVPTISHGLRSGDYSLFTYSGQCSKCNGDREVMGLPCKVCHGSGLGIVQDYSGIIAVERKSLIDLFGSVGRERDRFEREIIRLNEMLFSLVVVEATTPEIMRPSTAYGQIWPSKMSPRAVHSTILSWSLRYPRVHWHAAGSRAHGEYTVYEILHQFYRHEMEALKNDDRKVNQATEVNP